jgi:hypothetical protein
VSQTVSTATNLDSAAPPVPPPPQTANGASGRPPDLLDEAMQHTGEREPIYHGTFGAEARAVKLVKGIGKVAFDDATDEPAERRVSVDVTVMPLDPLRGPITRSMITSSAEWKLLRQSLLGLGLQLSQANGQPVRIRFVEDAALGTYTDKAGLTKPRTALVLEAVFASEADALEDYQRTRTAGVTAGGGASAPPAQSPQPQGSSAAAGAPPPGSISKEVAQAFLPGLWKASNGDATVFGELLRTSPAGAHFALTSPEVVALTGQQSGG